jgi:diguanylate cyclase (GGDEF)-like protein
LWHAHRYTGGACHPVPAAMSIPADSPSDAFLGRLLEVVDRIAAEGDFSAMDSLLSMTSAHSQSPVLTALAESFARMVVKLEAREYELECTIDDLKSVKTELEKANYDALTGLPNRVIARDRLHQALQQALKTQGQLAVMFLDLDKFKWVNDNLGHAAGDELLQQVAQRGRECLRPGDTFARLGGDEFLCVLPVLVDPEEAAATAQRFVDALSRPFALRDAEARIGTSVGIALYPAHGASVNQLIERADAALYAAKRAGRNVYRWYETVAEG